METALVIATLYAGPFVGQPLYCSTPENPLYYSPDTTPWAAFPVEDYQSGKIHCGDPYVIRFTLPEGRYRYVTVRALDAGPFSRYCVLQPDGSCPHIAVDVPAYWWPVEGISAEVEVMPLNRLAREWGMVQ